DLVRVEVGNSKGTAVWVGTCYPGARARTTGRPRSRVGLTRLRVAVHLFLQDRQVVVRQLQDEAGARGSERRPAAAAAQALVRPHPPRPGAGPDDQLVADGGEPFGPERPAGGPHGEGGVVVAVVVVRNVADRAAAVRAELHQVVEAPVDGRAVVHAG